MFINNAHPIQPELRIFLCNLGWFKFKEHFMKYITLCNLRMMVSGSKVFALLCFVNIDESSLK
jgi:hypothetical protein